MPHALLSPLALVLTCLGFTSLAQAARAQVTLEDYAAIPPIVDPFGAEFGRTVKLAGEWAVVVDPLANRIPFGTTNVKGGRLFFYQRLASGWVLRQVIDPPRDPYDHLDSFLGVHMSLVGQRLVIGGLKERGNNGAGTVFTYEFDGTRWTFSDELESRAPFMGQYFGYGVKQQGDDLYVAVLNAGIPNPTVNPPWPSGIIERHERQGGRWVYAETIEPVSLLYPAPTCAEFLAVDGDVLVTACSPGNNGYLRIYEGGPGHWQEVALTQPTQLAYPADLRFGQSIDVSGEWIAVGVPILSWFPFFPLNETGQVHMFRRLGPGNWVRTQVLRASNGWGGGGFTDKFGWSLDLDGERLLVGAWEGRNGAGQRYYGQAYLFELIGSTWVERERFGSTASETMVLPGNAFGCSVALDGPFMVIGDRIAPSSLSPTSPIYGAAYFYERSIGTTGCTGVPNPTGATASLTARGSDRAAIGAINFTGLGLPVQSPGLLIGAPAAGFVANPGGSVGNLCLGSGILRLTTGTGPADATGTWRGALELPEPGQTGPFQVQAGTTWHFQLWYRQPGTPPSSNFSGSLAVAFD